MEPLTNFFLGVVFIILLVIGFQGYRMGILLKMGLRNVTRRKVNTLIVVLGLMIGTSIISGSLVVGDTLKNMFTKGVYDSYHETDEVIFTYDQNGSYAFFDEDVYEDIKILVENDPQLSTKVEGLSPEILTPISVFDVDTNLSESEVTLVGFDYQRSTVFGGFTLEKGGKTTGENLGENEALVNEWLAEEIDIEDGHYLQIFYGENLSKIYRVTVVKNEGRAGYGWGYGVGSGYNVFIPLHHAQKLLNQTDKINYIKVSNVGGVRDGMEKSDDVEKLLTPHLYTPNSVLFLRKAKQESVENAIEGSEQLQQLFMVMGIFTIIAGIMLVINIFVMLAEERKSEMGMSRAVGMKRRHLMYMFLFEGSSYSVLSALVGTIVGLGVAAVIIYAFSRIFIPEGDFNPMEFFTFTLDSLVIAFCAGLLITLLTIWYSSRKVSKLNIIRAIRNIPEPRYQRHELSEVDPTLPIIRQMKIRIHDLMLRHYEYILILTGVFLVLAAFVKLAVPMYHKEWAGYGGLSLAIYGVGLLLRRYVPDRWAFTIAGAAVLTLWALPFDHYEILFGVEMEGEMEMFVISGLFMVSSALMIILYNDHLILGTLIKIFGRFRSLAPIFKMAVSYPMNSRFRTGMTVGMFALIIFTITVLAMIMGLIGGNIDKITEEQSGGYDMVVRNNNPDTPLTGISAEIARDDNNLSSNDFSEIVPLYTSFSLFYAMDGDMSEEKRNEEIEKNRNLTIGEFQKKAEWYDIIGCTGQFFEESDYQLEDWDKDSYKDYTDAWKAVQENDSLAIVDISVLPEHYGPNVEGLALGVGDYAFIRDALNHSKTVKVVGITKQGIVRGIFVVGSVVTEEFDTKSSSIALVKFNDELSDKEQERIAKDLESEMVIYGIQTFVIKQELEDSLRAITNFFYLLEAFLGLGLIVGIAGLGIITIRAVTERRQQVGMLRAIGFKRSMIHMCFLIESSFIALLGIVLGVVLGIVLALRMWLEEFEGVDFVVPWSTLLLISLISYVFTFICTYGPSTKAAKISPAEALRYVG